jgi:xeroderma pigmentosum group C-complementing protein
MDSDDDEMDWEEVLPESLVTSLPSLTIKASEAPIQITIKSSSFEQKAEAEAKKAKSQAEALERFTRLQAHRLHTVALLANASIRNSWANDKLLQVLYSPLCAYSKSAHPDSIL